MTQNQLNREIANATGETVSEIRHRGFQPLLLEPVDLDPQDMTIDWDDYDLHRNVPVFEQRQRRAFA